MAIAATESSISAANPAPARRHIRAFDYFRAIAILVIVAGHSYGPWTINSTAEIALSNLVTGGTALFVFISGFFLHNHFYRSFKYTPFMSAKIRNVFIPYIILSLTGLFFITNFMTEPGAEIPIHEPMLSYDYLKFTVFQLYFGNTTIAYWYIPFIMIVFIITPAYIFYIKLPTFIRIPLLIALLILSSFIQRPAENLSPMHSVSYYTPVYMLGINYSIHKHELNRFLAGKTLLLAILTVAVALLQALLSPTIGNFVKETIFSYNGVGFMIFQKSLMCLLFVSALNKLEDTDLPWLTFLAASSFAVFFLHPWVLLVMSHSGLTNLYYFLPGIAVWMVNFALAMGFSLLISVAIKRALGARSRYVIGW